MSSNTDSEDHLVLIGNLPSEIILNILLRLPLKSLSKFRYVCKSWFNGITHPQFTKFHQIISLQRKISPCLVICNKNDFALIDHQGFDNRLISVAATKIELKEFDEMFSGNQYGLVGSINGLLCFCTKSHFRPFKRDVKPTDFYICNPIIQEHVVVPRSSKYRRTHDAFGFGFDSSTGEYKVIRIFSHCGMRAKVKSYMSEGEIYTLGSGRWKEMNNVPYFSGDCEAGVFANGCLHWLTLKSENMQVVETLVICKFDVESEQFCFIEVPSVVIENPCIKYLGVIDEELCIMNLNFGQKFEVWVVKSDSWSKKFVFGKHILDNPYIGLYEARKSKSGEFLLWGYDPDESSWSMKITPHSNLDGYTPPYYLTYCEPERRTVQPITVQSDMICWEPIVFLGSLLSPKNIEMSTTRPRLS